MFVSVYPVNCADMASVIAATYGYARQYSGVNLGSFTKHITSSNLSREGLRNLGETVMTMAAVEKLEAHRRAVSVRLDCMDHEGDGTSK